MKKDELFDDAVATVRWCGIASTGVLQRSFRIGYARAVHLIDLMEAAGIIGPANGLKRRKILNAPLATDRRPSPARGARRKATA